MIEKKGNKLTNAYLNRNTIGVGKQIVKLF